MGPARKTLAKGLHGALAGRRASFPGQVFATVVPKTESDMMRTNQNLGCGTKVRTTSLAISGLEAIGGSREEHASCSSSMSQTFVVPASAFTLPGWPLAEGLVKKADLKSGPPAASTLPGALPEEKIVKEADPQLGGPAKRVKLDVKRSNWKGATVPRSCCRDPRRAEPECRRRPGFRILRQAGR